VVTFVTWLIVRAELLVYKVFYNVISIKIHLIFSRRIKSEVSCGVFCSNESTVVTDDLAQCLCCVLLII